MPKSTVQKYLKILEDNGYIMRVSHYQVYSRNNPYRNSFIFPLKHLNELFYDEDVIAIMRNVEKECLLIKEKTNEMTDSIIEMAKNIAKPAIDRVNSKELV